MANPLHEQRTSSYNQDQQSIYPNLLSSSLTEHHQILKLQADTS